MYKLCTIPYASSIGARFANASAPASAALDRSGPARADEETESTAKTEENFMMSKMLNVKT